MRESWETCQVAQAIEIVQAWGIFVKKDRLNFFTGQRKSLTREGIIYRVVASMYSTSQE